MSDTSLSTQAIKELLQNTLSQSFEWEIVPVPAHGDKMVRLRTLEDALEDFDNEYEAGLDQHEPQRYLIQVKPRKSAQAPSRQPTQASFNAAPYTMDENNFNHLGGHSTGHMIGSAKPKNADGTSSDSIYLANGTLNIDFLFQNAELLSLSGEHVLARNIFAKIAQVGQSGAKTAQALLGMAGCFEQENNFEAAREKLEESIAYHPTIESYQRLAALLIQQNKAKPAAEALDRALHLKDLSNKTRYELHKACGNSWMRANELAFAEKHYKKALEVDPSADEIQANLGALYLHAGKAPEARRRFQDAVAASPKNDKAIAGLGSCFYMTGDKQAAHDHFAQALEINVQNAQAVFHLVKCAYELKSYATAARMVEEYVQVAPININLLYSLAGLQFHLGRMNDSRQTCEKILELSPGHAGAEELLGMSNRF